MNFEVFKQIRDNVIIKRIFIALLALIVFLYLKSFFTMGVYFDEVFLKKDTISNETYYIGKNNQGDIHIAVNGWANDKRESSAEVVFNLPNNIYKHYTVNFSDEDKWFQGNVEIKNENANTIFKGKYQKGNMFLVDVNNEPIIEGFTISIGNEKKEVIYDNDYSIPLINIVQFALHEKETIRGNGAMLFASLILIFITFIDIKYPLFFFELRHSFEVENPKPTEFYITMQRVGWGVYSIIAFVLLIMAI